MNLSTGEFVPVNRVKFQPADMHTTVDGSDQPAVVALTWSLSGEDVPLAEVVNHLLRQLDELRAEIGVLKGIVGYRGASYEDAVRTAGRVNPGGSPE